MAHERPKFKKISFNVPYENYEELRINLHQEWKTQSDFLNLQIEKYNKSKRKKQAS